MSDDRGSFLLVKSLQIDYVLPVKVGEALALLQALKWVAEVGVNRVMFEMDCQQVVQSINFGCTDVAEFG